MRSAASDVADFAALLESTEEFACTVNILGAPGGRQAVMPDAVEALGQRVQQEAADGSSNTVGGR